MRPEHFKADVLYAPGSGAYSIDLYDEHAARVAWLGASPSVVRDGEIDLDEAHFLDGATGGLLVAHWLLNGQEFYDTAHVNTSSVSLLAAFDAVFSHTPLGFYEPIADTEQARPAMTSLDATRQLQTYQYLVHSEDTTVAAEAGRRLEAGIFARINLLDPLVITRAETFIGHR